MKVQMQVQKERSLFRKQNVEFIHKMMFPKDVLIHLQDAHNGPWSMTVTFPSAHMECMRWKESAGNLLLKKFLSFLCKEVEKEKWTAITF